MKRTVLNPQFAFAILAASLCRHGAAAITLEWTRQFGTTTTDSAGAVSADGSGNVYLTGTIWGRIPGPGDQTTADAFVNKYDASGSLIWTRQFGSTNDDSGDGVSADSLGNVFVLGATEGNLAGPNAGENDVFLAKYDANGTQLWTRQIGTPDYDYSDGQGVSADGMGNVYIAGTIWGRLVGPTPSPGDRNADAFVSKFDSSGSLLWTRELGTAEVEVVYGASADGLGNVYISGHTRGSLGDTNAGSGDTFVAKYDEMGNHLWTRQLGSTAYEYNWGGVSADRLGNIYVAGETSGSLESSIQGSSDAFVAKYNAAGQLIWTRQLGTASSDSGEGVSVDGLGNVYISGNTGGSLGGAHAGPAGVFVGMYDTAGTLIWTRQIGMASSCSLGGCVSVDSLGNVFIAGGTRGSLGGPNAGDSDAFVAKYVDGLTGDFNTDGTVDAADYVVWRNGLGTTHTQSDNDAWRANFGRTAAGAADVAGSFSNGPGNIPEPTGAWLVLCGLTLVLAGRCSCWREARDRLHIIEIGLVNRESC
jgi:hypothetical protein